LCLQHLILSSLAELSASQGHRQRGIWILRDGKIAVWETGFNVARADQAGGVAKMLG